MALHEQFESLPAARRATFVERALDDPVTRAAITPSAVQERMIVMSSWSGGAAAYNLSTATRFHGPLDVVALHEAYRRLQLRHEQLTRRFVHHEGMLLALPGEPREARPVLDVAIPAEDRPDDARRRARAAAATPFEVLGAPLTRLQVVRYDATDHLVLLDVHHAVADGRSLEIIDRDLARCYDDAHRRLDSVWPAPAGRYADYVLGEQQAERDQGTEQALRRVLDRLAGAPALLDLPTDQPRPSTQDFAGATVVRELDPRTSAALLRLAQAARTTLFSVGLALFADAIRHTSGQDDLVVGVPVLGRPSLGLDDVVGMFVNTVPVRLDLTGTTVPRAVARRVHDAWVDAVEDQLVPLDAVVDAVGADRDASRPPVFQVTFALAEDTGERAAWPDLVAEPVEVDGGSAKFDLALTLHRRGDRLRLELEHATSVVDRASADRVLDLVQLLADAATQDPDDDVRGRFRHLPGALPQTPAWDTERVDVELPAADHVWDLVRAAARRTPETVAVRTATTSLTYAGLVGRAGVLARRLHAEGVAPGSRVGVMLARSEELVPALLAVWAHGSSYVPLDPTYPTERLAFMLRDAGCRALLVDDAVPEPLGEVCDPIDVRNAAGPTTDDLPVTQVTAEHEAYLLYTSGSTGTPKGVSIPHRAVLAMVRGSLQVFGTAPLRRSLAATSISFDVSTVELYPTLSTGGTVHLVDSLLDGPREVPASTFTAGVPTLLSAALDIGSLDVSGMVVAAGGEPLPRSLVERLTAAGAQRVVNIYGPSEDCTYSTAAVVAAGEAPPIGWAVPGGRAYVLDRDGYVVPPGAVGEVHLAGAGLADGYASRPRLTAERFVPDPVGDEPGGRCYRTGDLARLRPDGALVYLGRSDRQVKVNGLRIELGEVEAALLASPGVTSAVALVQRDARSARLAAAVTGDVGLDPRALRRDLARRLPRALVPAVVVPVDSLPRLANGKTDVTAVRDLLPAFGTSVRTTSEPPPTAVGTQREDDDAERLVRECWIELLGSSHGGDFFAEGGTSLTALRLALRLTDRSGTRVTLADVFTGRTVEALAAHVRARPRPASGPAIRTVPFPGPRRPVTRPAVPLVGRGGPGRRRRLRHTPGLAARGAARRARARGGRRGPAVAPSAAAAPDRPRRHAAGHPTRATDPAAAGRAARPERPAGAVPVLRRRTARRARRTAAVRRGAVATRHQEQRSRAEGPPPRRRRLVPRRRGRGPRRALRPVPQGRRRGARGRPPARRTLRDHQVLGPDRARRPRATSCRRPRRRADRAARRIARSPRPPCLRGPCQRARPRRRRGAGPDDAGPSCRQHRLRRRLPGPGPHAHVPHGWTRPPPRHAGQRARRPQPGARRRHVRRDRRPARPRSGRPGDHRPRPGTRPPGARRDERAGAAGLARRRRGAGTSTGHQPARAGAVRARPRRGDPADARRSPGHPRHGTSGHVQVRPLRHAGHQ
ncbi:amino acid adenylation domain-containing protein [Aeromicrobium sp. SORGH_AS981]|nr:amino acid adenylation domain-containing protein [Aeromicrobium sp. SORGH_AS_0981]MDR6117811.1 amino acid adenylation domain-containing protein [Aeromicrobium sp. SORGH_AS_0981]